MRIFLSFDSQHILLQIDVASTIDSLRVVLEASNDHLLYDQRYTGFSLSYLRFYYKQTKVSQQTVLSNFIPEDGVLSVYAICTTNVRLNETTKSVNYYTNYPTTHLLDFCISSFGIPVEDKRNYQLLMSSGSILPMNATIPFHGYKEAFTLRYIGKPPSLFLIFD